MKEGTLNRSSTTGNRLNDQSPKPDRPRPILSHHAPVGKKLFFNRPISRRNFLKSAGIFAAGALLASCASPNRLPASLGPVQLVYQDWRTDWFPAMAQEMLDQFHQMQPNIRVFYTPDPEALNEQMMLDFEAGTAPDVMAGCCDFFPAWAQKGYLLDLTPFIQADLEKETIEDWDSIQFNALSLKNGIQFALPKYHGALALYYNKDLFDRLKVDYPDTSWDHDDYLLAMKEIQSAQVFTRNKSAWSSMLDISWERIQMHVNGWGGHFVDPQDDTHSRMSDEEAIQAMGWLRDRIWTDRLMASPLDVNQQSLSEAFINEQVAMIEDGSWALKEILENAPFRVGVTTFPAGPKRRVTLATTDGFGIYAGTQHPEAAWELLKFLTGREYGRAMMHSHLLQPARASLVEEWIQIIQGIYPQSEEMDLGAFADGHINGYSVTAEIFANMAPARQIVQEAWEQIYVLGQAPVEMMQEISSQIEVFQVGEEA